MTRVRPTPAEIALGDRLRLAHHVLADGGPDPGPEASLREVLLSLVARERDCPDHRAAWLLLLALTGAFPNSAAVRATRRALALSDDDRAIVWLLDALLEPALKGGDAHARLRIVSDRPIVDVDFTAKSELLTGIQRVVRRVAADWSRRQDVELVAWNRRGGGYRALTVEERRRLLGADHGAEDHHTNPPVEILVPWGVPVVLTEVPTRDHSERLAAIATLGAASIRAVGYDCIPISSAETVPLAEPEKFGRYLELVKYSDRVAGISESASREFEGFVDALPVQGLTGPRVTTCALPTTELVSDVVADADPPHARPVVVCIGTVGRRKNQTALVVAAELLWREGLDFELQLLGNLGAERTPLQGLVPELQSAGRPLVVEAGVSDERIAATLRRARCLVFPSLHEGFGLPIVEALSYGIPVITSDFGSLRELADGQGGLLVDPQDQTALTDALRLLLTDDTMHANLADEARARPARGWQDYATQLWEVLLG